MTKVSDEEAFELTDDDFYVIEIFKNIAHRFLKNSLITPKQVIGLGNALYGLERLPLVTLGLNCEFGIAYTKGTNKFEEMHYFTFRITEWDIQLSIGGSVYDQAVGSDSFSEPGWHIEVGGYRSTDTILIDLEDSIIEYLNLGAEIDVIDESEIEYENNSYDDAKKDYEERAKKLLGKTEGRVLTPEDRQLLKNQLEYHRYLGLLPSQIGQKPRPEPLFNYPMNVLATKALFEAGAEHEPETMPITYLMTLILQADWPLGSVRDKPDVWAMVDALADLPEDEALERLELLKVPQGWEKMDWKALALSLLNRVGDLRDEILNG